MFSINPSAGEPIYRQLSEQIKRMVASGQLKPGDELPSVRELAAQHAVNPMTISKAYSLLEAEGVLQRQRGKSMTIAVFSNAIPNEMERLLQLQPLLQQLLLAAKQLQLSEQAVLSAVQKAFNQR